MSTQMIYIFTFLFLLLLFWKLEYSKVYSQLKKVLRGNGSGDRDNDLVIYIVGIQILLPSLLSSQSKIITTMKDIHAAFAINLKERPDRFAHISEQFHGRPEFDFKALTFDRRKPSTKALWENIVEIISYAKTHEKEYVIICEDDHKFTEVYNNISFAKLIVEARKLHADILIGGVSSYTSAVQVSPNLFWIDKFSGLQFSLIFNSFFNSIIKATFQSWDAADHKISGLTDRKFVIYPFISIQKEFGYSDVTKKNNVTGSVTHLFVSAAEMMKQLCVVKNFYKAIISSNKRYTTPNFQDISMSLKVILQTGQNDELAHIKQQFSGRNEFDVTLIETVCHNSERKIWEGLVSAIQTSSFDEEDVVIICTSEHEFTEHYDKQTLFEQIVKAHGLGADLLLGGAGNFGQAVLIDNGMFWVNPLLSAQFIVVFEKFYKKLLSYEFLDDDISTEVLSTLTSHKMLLFPFLSKIKTSVGHPPKRFDYVMENGDVYSSTFEESAKRLAVLETIDNKFCTRN